MTAQFSDAIGKQRDFLKSVEKQMKVLRKGGAAASQSVVADKRAMLANLDRRLALATEARSREIARLDDEIDRLKNKVTALKTEIDGDLAVLSGNVKGGAIPGGGGVKTQTGLRTVRGIGEVAAKKLRESGIVDIAKLVATQPAKLAKTLGTTEKRASDIIAAAKGRKE